VGKTTLIQQLLKNYHDNFLSEECSEEQLMERYFCLREIHGMGIDKAAALR
jgi:deoxyadenosine/deoxycytidine kinase